MIFSSSIFLYSVLFSSGAGAAAVGIGMTTRFPASTQRELITFNERRIPQSSGAVRTEGVFVKCLNSSSELGPA